MDVLLKLVFTVGAYRFVRIGRRADGILEEM